MLAEEKAVGWLPKEPRMMWIPPYIMTFVFPLAQIKYELARRLWILSILIFLILGCDIVWSEYGGQSSKRPYIWLISTIFVPSLFMFMYGQFGSIILLGLVCFASFEKRGRDIAAGAFLPLISLKPHLVLLFWFALIVWLNDQKRWKIIIGAVISFAVSAALPTIWNPHVWQQYLTAMGNEPVTEWITPTLGAILRLALGWSHFYLQFLPFIAAVLWFAYYWRRQKKYWRWEEAYPWLIFVSLIFCPYCWIHDFVLLLIPVIARFATDERRQISNNIIGRALLFLLLINIVLLKLPINHTLGMSTHVWFVTAILIWYLVFERISTSRFINLPK